jgi:hypothetical protein
VGLLRISQDLGASPADSSSAACSLEHVVVVVQCRGLACQASGVVLTACLSSLVSTILVMGIDVVERFHFFKVALHLSFRWILVLECALEEL